MCEDDQIGIQYDLMIVRRYVRVRLYNINYGHSAPLPKENTQSAAHGSFHSALNSNPFFPFLSALVS